MKDNDQLQDVNVIDLDKTPFQGMKISEHWKALSLIKERTLCPKCHKSRMYFCYTCYVVVTKIKDIVPKVKVS